MCCFYYSSMKLIKRIVANAKMIVAFLMHLHFVRNSEKKKPETILREEVYLFC